MPRHILTTEVRSGHSMLIKQPTLAVERKEEKREEGYKGLHSGLTITGLTTTHELWYTTAATSNTYGNIQNVAGLCKSIHKK